MVTLCQGDQPISTAYNIPPAILQTGPQSGLHSGGNWPRVVQVGAALGEHSGHVQNPAARNNHVSADGCWPSSSCNMGVGTVFLTPDKLLRWP